jgi:hypothetical protein
VVNAKIIIVCILLPFFGFCQTLKDDKTYAPDSKTEYYLNLYSRTDLSQPSSHQKFIALISALEAKKNTFRNDEDFLHYVFKKVHQKILKNYTAYCSFNALAKDGTYNCLTAIAAYALLLDHFNVDFKIIETNYHIFIIVNSSARQILFESTDPLDGFVSSPIEINKRINTYKQNLRIGNFNNRNYYRYSFDLYHEVNLDQLAGLMYYNLAVDAYNNKAFDASINYLDKTIKFYQSVRVEEFSKVLQLVIAESNFNGDTNAICLKKIQALRKKMPAFASISRQGN